jgi:hypothetical protein
MTNTSVSPSSANGVDPLAGTSQNRGQIRDHDWTSIVAQIQGGQDTGIEELYRILNRGLRYYLGRQLGQQDLEDRVHEIFLTVISAIRKGHDLPRFTQPVIIEDFNTSANSLGVR